MPEGGGKIHCRRGCANCCRLAVEATLPEALAAAQALSGSQAAALADHVERLRENLRGAADLRGYLRSYREKMRGCPFLEGDGACGIYDVRPLACRALLSTRNPEWCGVDLSALHPLEKQAFLSGLDPAVVAFPTHYAAAPQEAGRELEEAAAIETVRRWGFSLSGNFPFLVWLARERGLAEAGARGREGVAELLQREGDGLSFLLRLG